MDEFWSFGNLVGSSHEHIHTRWVADFEYSLKHARNCVFIVNGNNIFARHLCKDQDGLEGEILGTKGSFELLIVNIKSECMCDNFFNSFLFFMPCIFVSNVCN